MSSYVPSTCLSSNGCRPRSVDARCRQLPDVSSAGSTKFTQLPLLQSRWHGTRCHEDDFRQFPLMLVGAFLLAGCGGGGGDDGTGRTRPPGASPSASPTRRWTEPRRWSSSSPRSNSSPRMAAPSPSISRPAQSIDLLALAGGGSRALLEEHSVPAGRYQWVRLLIDAQQNQPSSYIDLASGERFPLFVPERQRERAQADSRLHRGRRQHQQLHHRLRPAQVRHRAARPGAELPTETGIAHGRQPAGRRDCRDGRRRARHRRLLAAGLYLHGRGGLA